MKINGCLFTRLLFLIFLISGNRLTYAHSNNDTAVWRNKPPIDSFSLKKNNLWKLYILQEGAEKIKYVGNVYSVGLHLAEKDAPKLAILADGDYLFQKIGSINGGFAYSYYDYERRQASANNLGQNKMAGFRMLEVGGRICLSDKIVRKKCVITMDKRKLFDHRAVRYGISAKLQRRRIYSIRGGYYINNAVVYPSMNGNELVIKDESAVKASDGTVIIGPYATNSTTNGAYFGLSSIGILNFVSRNSIEKYKNRIYETKYFLEGYCDVFIGNTSYDPFVIGGISHAITPNEKGSFQNNRLGGRLGVQATDNSTYSRRSTKCEVGYYPGLKGTGFYMLLCLCFNFGTMR